jgi:CRP/FNR family nitrogen fixation transcriptional regulator
MIALNASRQTLDSSGLAPATAAPGLRITYSPDETIFAEGDTARNVYVVLSGAVRTVRMLPDGARQVVEFHLPGDVFGFESAGEHDLTAQSIGESTLRIMRRGTFFDTAAGGVDSLDDPCAVVLGKLHRTKAHVTMLGRQSAFERMVAFLLDMNARAPRDEVALPMSHQDIADHLGLTLETVSRTLAQLQAADLMPGMETDGASEPSPYGANRPVTARRRGHARYRPAYRG